MEELINELLDRDLEIEKLKAEIRATEGLITQLEYVTLTNKIFSKYVPYLDNDHIITMQNDLRTALQMDGLYGIVKMLDKKSGE